MTEKISGSRSRIARFISRRIIDAAFTNDNQYALDQTMRSWFLHELNLFDLSGERIRNVIDVGAHKGEWSAGLSRIFPGAKFYCVEANPQHEPHLVNLGFPYEICALSSDGSARDFYHTGGTGDSFFRERSDVYRGIAPKRLNTRTLDQVRESNNWPVPQLLKLDTQGSEIEILMGASKTLPEVPLVYIECSWVEYNEGAPGLSDVIRFMSEQEFSPICIGEIHRDATTNTLIQTDVLFGNIAQHRQNIG